MFAWIGGLFSWLGNPLGWLPPERRRAVISWTVHVLLVLLVVVGLYFLNAYTGLERVLRTRTLGLNVVWLPLLFILGYAVYWLIRGLFAVLGPDGPAGEFDDIEAAWSQIRAELDRAGLDPRRVPLFLVLGRPDGAIEQVFASSRFPYQIRNLPAGPASMHVHATREAIFVTAETAGVLGVLAEHLHAAAPVPAATSAMLTDLFPAGDPTTPASVDDALALADAPAVLLLGETEPTKDKPLTRKRASLLKRRELVDLQTRRLRHVCRLLARERRPYCPVNGVIVLLPGNAVADADNAAESTLVARADLETARNALQLDCPRLILVCDAETLPGFGTLVQYFPEGGSGPNRHWVIGQHFPLAPDEPESRIPALLEDGMRQVGDTLLPMVVGKLWVREGEGNVTDRASAVEANVQLYEFLHAIRERLVHLGRLAGRSVAVEGAPPLLGGCYLAGTGQDGKYGQGFVTGVLRRAVELQNSVRWTPDARDDDSAYERYAFVGYTLTAVFVAGVVVLVAWWW